MTDQADTMGPIFEEPPPPQIKADPKVARRARLLANLEKGRKTALESRKKKAMCKKLKKQGEVDEMDIAIQEKMLKKAQEKPEVLTLREELEKLRMEIKAKPAPRATPPPTPAPTPATPAPLTTPAPTPAPLPTPTPAPTPLTTPTPTPLTTPAPLPPRPPTPRVVISTYSAAPW